MRTNEERDDKGGFIAEPKLLAGPAQKKGAPSPAKKRATSPFKTVPNHLNPNKQHGDSMNGHNTSMENADENSAAFRSRATEIMRFRVYARVRPFIPEELADMEGQERRSVVEMTENKTVILDPKDGWAPKAQFEFDASLWSIPPEHRIVHTFNDTRHSTYATQRNVYDVIAKDLVPHVFDGFNSCVLTYGLTGSGKTYTMMGKYDPRATCGGDGEEGIIPRVSNDLFTILDKKRKEEEKPNIRFRIEVTFVEIYMERVRDLLDPALKNSKGSEKLQDARIRQDPYSGPFVEGVTKYQAENWAQCCLLLERGSTHRTTCATAVHNQSSRSHAIFQLTVIQEETIPAKDRYSRPTVRCQAGRINLVDLAGSERGGFQDYVKESAAINTSLLALRRVIDNLTERQNVLMEQAKAEVTGGYFQERTLPQVPFRDSVLTWLLSDSIGGNARTTMVATLSPLAKNYGDTLATLQWSSKARNLVTLVKVNDAQTTVTDGMTSKAGELHNAVRIQRQNMDTLLESLRSKQAIAENLEKEMGSMTRQMTSIDTETNKMIRKRQAVTVQRTLLRKVWAKQIKTLEERLQASQKRLAQKNATVANSNRQRDDALERENAVKRKLQNLKAREEELHKLVAKNDATDEAFREELTSAELRYQTEMEAAGADNVVSRLTESIENRTRMERRKLDDLREKVKAAERKAISMEAKVNESKQEEWKEQVRRDGEEVVQLRSKLGELQARWDAVREENDTLKAMVKRK
ncbi:kinesin [Trypanosoma brucei equiperdum]|uniref:Kinesin-like protein n=1 Tax=Trypanosoma brucei equiperdum TaxID=630700 RepID=A0A3L6L2G8_9TRYP|nr:kinesin [Trypanosoma brucei equiperdum]